MGQQLADPAVWLGGEASEDVLQVNEGLVAVEAGGLDQAHDGGGTLAGAQTAGKEPVLASQGDRPDLVLDPVVIDGHLPVAQVMGERGPAPEAVVDGSGAGRAVGDLPPALQQPTIYGDHREAAGPWSGVVPVVHWPPVRPHPVRWRRAQRSAPMPHRQ